MTNLAICKICRALTADTPEDIGEHRRKHKEQAEDIERARRTASEAKSALELNTAAIRDYERALDQRPVPVDPEINMRVVEDDEDDDLLDDEDSEAEPVPATAHVNAADDPDEFDAEDDDEPAPIGSSLYTPGTYQ